jgi:hypothetical protein
MPPVRFLGRKKLATHTTLWRFGQHGTPAIKQQRRNMSDQNKPDNPINENHLRMNKILGGPTYILIGVDATKTPPFLSIHLRGIQQRDAMAAIVGLASQAAQQDPQMTKFYLANAAHLDERAFLEMAMEISTRLQQEEVARRGLKN